MNRLLMLSYFSLCFVLSASAARESESLLPRWGEKCGETPLIRCEAGLECSTVGTNRICAKVVGQGESCGITPPILCAAGLECAFQAGICAKPVGEGERCREGVFVVPIPCQEGLVCRRAQSADFGLCSRDPSRERCPHGCRYRPPECSTCRARPYTEDVLNGCCGPVIRD